MLRYKLTRQDMTTYNGFKNTVGETYVITKLGNELCTDQVFHFYDSPLLAVLLNPIHADYTNPRLFEVEVGDIVAHDGLKGGTKQITYLRRVSLPEMTLTQKAACALLCVKVVCKDKDWNIWCNNWLSGKDRSAEAAARAAAGIAARITEGFAERAAAWAVMWAVEAAAAEAAETETAAGVVARAAAWAVMWAVEAAAAEAAVLQLDLIKIAEEAMKY